MRPADLEGRGNEGRGNRRDFRTTWNFEAGKSFAALKRDNS